MNYLHHPAYNYGHAGIHMDQPNLGHPGMANSMDNYLITRPTYELAEYYTHMPVMEDYEEYAENLSRPRLTKEQVDTLEAQFQAHPKPNSNKKRELAVQTNLSLPRVAVSLLLINLKFKVRLRIMLIFSFTELVPESTRQS